MSTSLQRGSSRASFTMKDLLAGPVMMSSAQLEVFRRDNGDRFTLNGGVFGISDVVVIPGLHSVSISPR